MVFFGQPAYIFYVRFDDFRAVKIPVKRVFDLGHSYLRRVRARVALGLGIASGFGQNRGILFFVEDSPFVAGLGTLDYGCAVLIDSKALPKSLFGVPDLDLSEDPVRGASGRPTVQARGVQFWFR